jgi:hypothetical protein
MRTLFLTAVAAAALIIAPLAYAGGLHNGFGSNSTSGQGNIDNGNSNNSPNSGTATDTTTGPSGQLKKGNTDCNNCTTTTSGPGKK